MEIVYSELRAHLAECLDKTQVSDEPIIVTRKGVQEAVIISKAQYDQLIHPRNLSVREEYAQWKAGCTEGEMEGEDPFASVRERLDEGRDVSF